MPTKLRLLTLAMALAVITAIAIVACTPSQPTTVEVTREVQVPVTEIVTETERVEVPVTQIVTETERVEVPVTQIVTETERVEVTRVVEVTAPEAPKDTIVFSDLNWDSSQIQVRIAQYIVEHGYGFPTDMVFGGTIPLQTALLNGDTQITMEIWLPNQQEWWDNVTKTGQVIPVGKSLDDNWQSAFVVPTYVVEQNPTLASVFDIPDHVDLFKNTGKW